MHALILCSVQCLLALTWTLYVAFLPQLAAQAGLPRSQVAWILMMDQVIFVITDLALGVMADRVADAMRRLGGWVLAVSVVSALAFVMMPRAASPAWLVALTALWAATSSALRAPPMVLIARRLHGSAPSFLVACSLLGVGLAGAIGPVLTARLRDASPTLPFIAASTALVIAVMALRWIEPAAAPDSSGTADPSPASGHRPRSTHTWLLFAAFGLLALGFQIHTAVNSTPAYLRYVSPAKLVQVAPAFWIGFALCVLVPELAALRRHPARLVLLVAAACGALALFGVPAAGSLQALLVAQCVAGGLWGVLFGAMLRAALDAGHVGHEGAFTGLVFAVAAVAAFVRIATVYSGASKATPLASWLPWMPAVAWSMAALLLAALVLASAAPGRWHARSLAKP